MATNTGCLTSTSGYVAAGYRCIRVCPGTELRFRQKTPDTTTRLTTTTQLPGTSCVTVPRRRMSLSTSGEWRCVDSRQVLILSRNFVSANDASQDVTADDFVQVSTWEVAPHTGPGLIMSNTLSDFHYVPGSPPWPVSRAALLRLYTGAHPTLCAAWRPVQTHGLRGQWGWPSADGSISYYYEGQYERIVKERYVPGSCGSLCSRF